VLVLIGEVAFDIGDLVLVDDGIELVLLRHLVPLHLSKLFWVQARLLIGLILLVLRMHLVEWHESGWKRGWRQALWVLAVLGTGSDVLVYLLGCLRRLVVVLVRWQLGHGLLRRLGLTVERAILAGDLLLSSHQAVRLLQVLLLRCGLVVLLGTWNRSEGRCEGQVGLRIELLVRLRRGGKLSSQIAQSSWRSERHRLCLLAYLSIWVLRHGLLTGLPWEALVHHLMLTSVAVTLDPSGIRQLHGLALRPRLEAHGHGVQPLRIVELRGRSLLVLAPLGLVPALQVAASLAWEPALQAREHLLLHVGTVFAVVLAVRQTTWTVWARLVREGHEGWVLVLLLLLVGLLLLSFVVLALFSLVSPARILRLGLLAVGVLGGVGVDRLAGHLALPELLLRRLVVALGFPCVLLLRGYGLDALRETRSEAHWDLLLVPQIYQVWEVACSLLLQILLSLASVSARCCLGRVGLEVEVRQGQFAFELRRQAGSLLLLFDAADGGQLVLGEVALRLLAAHCLSAGVEGLGL